MDPGLTHLRDDAEPNELSSASLGASFLAATARTRLASMRRMAQILLGVWYFSAIILRAYIEGSDQPNLRFIVLAMPGAAAARQPIPVTTHKGGYAAQSIAQSLAQAMGFKFENNGVSVMLRNPYLWGTGISQMRQLSRAANFVWGLDARGTLAIWPKGGARAGAGRHDLAQDQRAGGTDRLSGIRSSPNLRQGLLRAEPCPIHYVYGRRFANCGG